MTQPRQEACARASAAFLSASRRLHTFSCIHESATRTFGRMCPGSVSSASPFVLSLAFLSASRGSQLHTLYMHRPRQESHANLGDFVQETHASHQPHRLTFVLPFFQPREGHKCMNFNAYMNQPRQEAHTDLAEGVQEAHACASASASSASPLVLCLASVSASRGLRMYKFQCIHESATTGSTRKFGIMYPESTLMRTRLSLTNVAACLSPGLSFGLAGVADACISTHT